MKAILLTIVLLSSLFSFAQRRWKPYSGLYVSMDAAGYYVGPSFQLGTDYRLKKQLALSFYLHYFPEGTDIKYDDGSFEKGKYRSTTMALLLQKHVSKNENKGWFLAAGMAFQRSTDDYKTDLFEEHLNRSIVIAAIRFGYAFPLKKNTLLVELNGTGPYIGKTGPAPYYEKLIEVLTQLSLGLRWVL